MDDEDTELDLAAFESLILQVFEEQEDRSGALTYPLKTQKQALDFVKLLNRKGFPYQHMCEAIGEKPQTFRSWRLGNGNTQVGMNMMKRINKTVQEAMNMTDTGVDLDSCDQDEIVADGFLDDIDSDGHDELSSSDTDENKPTSSAASNGDIYTASLVNGDVITESSSPVQSPNEQQEPAITDEDINRNTKTDDSTHTDDVTDDAVEPRPSNDNNLPVEAPSPESTNKINPGHHSDISSDVAVTEPDIKIQQQQQQQSCHSKPSEDAKVCADDVIVEKSPVDSIRPPDSEVRDSRVVGACVLKPTTDLSNAVTSGPADDASTVSATTPAVDDDTMIQSVDSERVEQTAVNDVISSDAQPTVIDIQPSSDAVAAACDNTDSQSVSETPDGTSSATADHDDVTASNNVTDSGGSIDTTVSQQEQPAVVVKEEPKVEYEASTKQLDLLSRLAMLKERAAQRKSEDEKTPNSSSSTSRQTSLTDIIYDVMPTDNDQEMRQSVTRIESVGSSVTGKCVTSETKTSSVLPEETDNSSKLVDNAAKRQDVETAQENVEKSVVTKKQPIVAQLYHATLQEVTAVSDKISKMNSDVKEEDGVMLSADTTSPLSTGSTATSSKAAFQGSFTELNSDSKSDTPNLSANEERTDNIVSEPLSKSVDDKLKESVTVADEIICTSKTEDHMTTVATSGALTTPENVTAIATELLNNAASQENISTASISGPDDSTAVRRIEKFKFPVYKPKVQTGLAAEQKDAASTSAAEEKTADHKNKLTELTCTKVDEIRPTADEKYPLKTENHVTTPISGSVTKTTPETHNVVTAAPAASIADSQQTIATSSEDSTSVSKPGKFKFPIYRPKVQTGLATEQKDESSSSKSEQKTSDDKTKVSVTPVAAAAAAGTRTDDAQRTEDVKSKDNIVVDLTAAESKAKTPETDKQTNEPAGQQTKTPEQPAPSSVAENRKQSTGEVAKPNESVNAICSSSTVVKRVKTAGRRVDVVMDRTLSGSVPDSYDSDLDAAASNEKTYSLVDRVRKLKASQPEASGYLYVFTDSPTIEDSRGQIEITGGQSRLPRFKVGVSRYPSKRLQQAMSFNPDMKLVIVASVKRRLEALRLVREKLGQFKVDSTVDWYTCDDDHLASVVDDVISEID